LNSIEPFSPSAQPTESVLGNDRKIGVPKLPDDDHKIIETAAEMRYRLQDVARRIVGARDERLQGCLRRKLPAAAAVEVRHNPELNTAHYRGLEVCSRVWTCPVCSARITNKRREELSKALAAAKLKNLYPVLITYTLRHTQRDRLEHVLDGLQDALRCFKSGRGYQDIKAEYGIVGGIRALETLFGENGWHPHTHELLFLDEELTDQQVAGLKKWLVDRWVKSLNKLGFDASYAHGIDVRTANSEIADYIAKYGREPENMSWQVEHEITKAPAKSGHREGLTPFQLLESYDCGDDRAGRLFLEYATAMQHRRQLVWSAGLRALLQLPPELADEQLPLEDETAAVETVLYIEAEQWGRICWAGIRGDVLTHVGALDWTGLRALFRRYGVKQQLPGDPPAKCDQQPVTLAQPVQLQLLSAPTKFKYQ